MMFDYVKKETFDLVERWLASAPGTVISLALMDELSQPPHGATFNFWLGCFGQPSAERAAKRAACPRFDPSTHPHLAGDQRHW